MARKPSFSKGDFVINNKGCEGVVIDYIDASKVLIEFLDDNKFRNYFEAKDIREGVFRNPFIPTLSGIGYIGNGVHTARVNGKICPAYKAWSGMFTRCYDERHLSIRPSYRGCEVAKEWHDFQVFAEWYKGHKFFNKGYHLDKDILVRGNKVYSEDTCCLVPPSLNTSVGIRVNNKDAYVGCVSLDKRSGTFNSSICKFGKSIYLGSYKGEVEATEVYLKAKKEYMRELAIIYKDKVTDRVFNALFNWEV